MSDAEQLYTLLWMSRPLMQATEAVVERELEGTGLTVRTRAVLEILLANGAATVPELANKLEIKRQYVQLMVNETLAEGLTSKQPNPRHKRSTMIALTEKGRALVEAAVGREMALVRSIGAEVDPGDVEAALKVVTSLIEKLKSEIGDT